MSLLKTALIVTESQTVLSVGATGELVNHVGGEAKAVYVPRTGQEMVAESSSPFLLPHLVYHENFNPHRPQGPPDTS